MNVVSNPWRLEMTYASLPGTSTKGRYVSRSERPSGTVGGGSSSLRVPTGVYRNSRRDSYAWSGNFSELNWIDLNDGNEPSGVEGGFPHGFRDG